MEDPIQLLVLQEFQLAAVDSDGAVARIVRESRDGSDPAVPLLTSIDDRHHVATLWAIRASDSTEPEVAQRAALEPFVSRWDQPRQYRPRITEGSREESSYYRLAVTESGINAADPRPQADATPDRSEPGAPLTTLGLLWIGQPLGTHAGLLLLVGRRSDQAAVRPDPRAWPLPWSRSLGVRIYESTV